MSAALAARYPDVFVVGIDTNERTREVALEHQWVAQAYSPDSDTFIEFLQNECDLVVLAIPAQNAREYFQLLEG